MKAISNFIYHGRSIWKFINLLDFNKKNFNNNFRRNIEKVPRDQKH